MGNAKRGVFWLIDDYILVVHFDENATEGVAKSGNNYNHKLIWDYVKPRKSDKPFDYYPRGRVENNSRGKTIIYMSPFIDEKYIPVIMEKFGITETPKIHYDGSEHYKCYLDHD